MSDDLDNLDSEIDDRFANERTAMGDEQTMPSDQPLEDHVFYVSERYIRGHGNNTRCLRVKIIPDDIRSDGAVVVNGNTLVDPVRFANAQRQLTTLTAEKEALLTQLLEEQGVNAGLREIKDTLTAERDAEERRADANAKKYLAECERSAVLAAEKEKVRELAEAVERMLHGVTTYSASNGVGTGPMHTATITDLSLLVRLETLAAQLKNRSKNNGG